MSHSARGGSTKSEDTRSISGALYAAAAYCIWGFSPLYWKLIQDVPPLHVATHRVVWSAPTLLAALICTGRFSEFLALIRTPRVWAMCGVSAVLIGFNWFLFIYSIGAGRLIEVSLGYYICPLITVFFASVIVKEELKAAQRVAIFLAGIGVLFKMYQSGHPPWLAINVAVSFALYGLVRKQIQVEALMGLAIETMLLSGPAIIALVYWQSTGADALFHVDRLHDVLLILSGAVTMIPLLFYAIGVRTAKLALVGFLQYIGPTIQLVFAIFVFHEPFELSSLWSFTAIWAGLVLFVWDSYRRPVIETCV